MHVQFAAALLQFCFGFAQVILQQSILLLVPQTFFSETRQLIDELADLIVALLKLSAQAIEYTFVGRR